MFLVQTAVVDYRLNACQLYARNVRRAMMFQILPETRESTVVLRIQTQQS
jgi:hypothetical protein